jgi:hypothetical protein
MNWRQSMTATQSWRKRERPYFVCRNWNYRMSSEENDTLFKGFLILAVHCHWAVFTIFFRTDGDIIIITYAKWLLWIELQVNSVRSVSLSVEKVTATFPLSIQVCLLWTCCDSYVTSLLFN